MADFEDDQAHIDYLGGLAKCPENRVHCVWFRDRYKVAMVMTIDLKTGSVFTGRMTPTAAQGTGTQQMTRAQHMSLKSVLSAMPPGVTTGSDLSCVHIGYRVGDKVETRRYLLARLPPAIQRIYDLAGGDIDTTIGEQVGGCDGEKPAS